MNKINNLTLLATNNLHRATAVFGPNKKTGSYFIDRYNELLEEADKDPFFYGVPLNRDADRILITDEEDVLGFFEYGRTTFEGSSYYRANRPYTAISYRGKRVMRDALTDWFRIRRPAMAWIDDSNVSSIRLYQCLGFMKSHPLNHKEKDGHVYFLPRNPTPIFSRS